MLGSKEGFRLSEWYETFFDELAFDLWRSLVPDDVTDGETALLLRELCGTEQGALRLLDVPCGDGRLALRVAAAGHGVVGVDLSLVAIERLHHDATAAAVKVTAYVSDMRDLASALETSPPFDGAWCMGNSFGYLDSPGTDVFLDAVSRSLRRAGRFVLDAATVAENVLANLGELDRYEAGDAILVNRNSYDALESTMVTDMTLQVGQRWAQRVVRHRVMTCREIIERLGRAGLVADDVFGGLDGQPFQVGSPRCLVVATRR
jgi:SAM-dependent methyltransferase